MANLKNRFDELIRLEWGEFCALEKDKNIIVDDMVLCSLIRVCAETDDISSINLAFDRIDGLLETLIDIKVPKFYTRYRGAIEIEPSPKQLEAPEQSEEDKPSNYDPATAKLRETLQELRKAPRALIVLIRRYKKYIEEGKPLPEGHREPRVNAVIVANLLKQVTKGRFKAIELVFNQIDGKLPKSIKLLGGEDVYVDDFTQRIAPAHAQMGEDGVYFAEDKIITTAWLRGFAQSQKGLEILAKGLEEE